VDISAALRLLRESFNAIRNMSFESCPGYFWPPCFSFLLHI